MAAVAQEILQQMVLLTDQLTQTMGRITTLEATISGQQQQGAHLKGGIFDKSKMLPDRPTREVEFKSWAEDYLEYIEAQDEKLHELMLVAQDSADPIDGLDLTSTPARRARRYIAA